METKLKPFDLEAAKNGAKVVTRDGHAVRIICYDRKNGAYPIVALLEDDEDDVGEHTIYYTNNGKYFYNPSEEENHAHDLFMAPVKRVGYGVVYKEDDGLVSLSDVLFDKVEDANDLCKASDGFAVAKIEWEE